MKTHQEQFVECSKEGRTDGKIFISFKNNPEMIPIFIPKESMDAIAEGKIKGFNLVACGKFGGVCSSKNKECQKLRGIQNEN